MVALDGRVNELIDDRGCRWDFSPSFGHLHDRILLGLGLVSLFLPSLVVEGALLLGRRTEGGRAGARLSAPDGVVVALLAEGRHRGCLHYVFETRSRLRVLVRALPLVLRLQPLRDLVVLSNELIEAGCQVILHWWSVFGVLTERLLVPHTLVALLEGSFERLLGRVQLLQALSLINQRSIVKLLLQL